MPDADPHEMILCRGGRIVSQVRVRCLRCCELAFSYCCFVIPRESFFRGARFLLFRLSLLFQPD
jgi:hypothetical protein